MPDKTVMRRGRSGLLALLLAGSLALVACGQTATGGTDAQSGHKATPTSQPATPTSAIPHAAPPPYNFPKQWLQQAGAPDAVAGFAFAPSAPQIGYTCTGLPGVATGSAQSINTSSKRQALDAPLAPVRSGRPDFYATHDGGATWAAPGIQNFGWSSVCRVFVNAKDADDVILYRAIEGSSPMPSEQQLLRSRDGGVTWQELTIPNPTNSTLSVLHVAVVGSRIIASIVAGANGGLPNDLFASDDGGKTWLQIGQSIANQHLFVGDFVVMGMTIVVSTLPQCQNGCGTVAPLSPGAHAGTRFGVELAPEMSLPTDQFASNDGGVTWAKLRLPTASYYDMHFVRSTDGTTYYGAVIARTLPDHAPNTSVVLYTRDSGVTWLALPTLDTVENGYLMPSPLAGVIVTPTGDVIVNGFHFDSQVGQADAGAFLLHPKDAAPSWRPLVLMGAGSSGAQAVPTAAGVRIWGINTAPGVTAGPLAYFDLP